MIYKLKCNKDLTIENNASASYNFGLSNILEVYSLSQSIPYTTKDLARTLLNFDVSTFNAAVSSGSLDATTISQSFLYLYTVPLTSSYRTCDERVEFKQVGSGSWQEGSGSSDGQLSQSANWISSSNAIVWAAEGGDFTGTADTINITKTFDDIKYELSSSWLANLTSSTTYGIAVKYTSAEETDIVNDYYRAFYSRHSWVGLKQPAIYVFLNDSIIDCRNSLNTNVTSSLYLFNYNSNENLTNISNLPVTCSLYSNSAYTTGSLIASGSASLLRTGIYYYNFSLTSSYSGTIYDKWTDFTGSVLLQSSSLVYAPTSRSTMYSYGTGNKFIVTTDLRVNYDINDIAVVRVCFYKVNDTNRTGSLLALIPMSQSYYNIIDKDSGNLIWGSDYYSRLSKDSGGNWFVFPMESLVENKEYKLQLVYIEHGMTNTITSDQFSFRVTGLEAINSINS